MKTIGFVDYFIDEWHSNNYIAWVKELCQKNGYDFEVKYAWAEADTFEGKMSTEEWCSEKGIEKCNSIEELCEKSDYIMILAPANPEKHLKYAETVLKYEKNTYIDKTFAPSLCEAKKIYELGEKYNTAFFSTSALRYSSELDGFDEIIGATVMGGGRSFEEYIVHQIEMLVKLMGVGADKVKVFSSGKQRLCSIKYKDGRYGFLEYSDCNPFAFLAEDKNGIDCRKNIESDYFKALLGSILDFFLSGKPPFEKEQTLEVIAMRDALIKAEQHPDKWIKIK